MTFFGITALGPPNPLQAGLTSALGLTVFSDEEFEAAFHKMDKDGSGTITPDEVEDLLYETYGFPPLEEEVAMFMNDFDLNKDGKVTLEEFKLCLTRMREKMNEKSKQAKEYTSFNQLKADRFKHRRVNNEVQDKFKVPVTFNQSLGFHVHDQQQKEIAKQEMKPIRHC